MEPVILAQLDAVCKGAPYLDHISARSFNQFTKSAQGAMKKLKNRKLVNKMNRYFFEELSPTLNLPAHLTPDSYYANYILHRYQGLVSDVNSKGSSKRNEVVIPAWNYLDTALAYFGHSGQAHFTKFGVATDGDRCISDGPFARTKNPGKVCLKRNDPALLVYGKFHSREYIVNLGDYQDMRLALDRNIKLLAMMHWSMSNGQLDFLPDPLFYAALCFNVKLDQEWQNKHIFQITSPEPARGNY